MPHWSRALARRTRLAPMALLIVACSAPAVSTRSGDLAATELPADALVREGRMLVIHHGCGDCHGGYDNPAATGWLAGVMRPEQIFQVGPFKTYARNITPDNTTGIGRFGERQIFNALRYGLRPGETPDVEITSSIPGQGNFPANPKYLAPPMPWLAFRHMSDHELRAIAAYIKRGVRPVTNRVQDSEGPPDFWAGTYAQIIGTRPPAPFPTANERMP